MIVFWIAAFGLYLLFAGTLTMDEFATAAVVACLAALWAYAAREISDERFAASSRQITPLLRALAGLPGDTARGGTILVKAAMTGGSVGRAVRTRFTPGARFDPAARSRRALAVLAASLAPPRFVIAFERGRAEAIVHTIEKIAAPPDPEWLT